MSLRTPLYDEHVAAGGRIVEFAGYDLPVQYEGIIAETLAVRREVGMFDVSHMARLRLLGPDARSLAEWITCNEVGALADGSGQYTLLTNDTGGCVDDAILYRVAEDQWRLVVNAANHEKDVEWIAGQNRWGVEVVDETEATAMVAVQGPGAIKVLAGLSDRPDDLREAGLFGTVSCSAAGVPTFAARSGYTGEDGFELVVPARDGPALWSALLAAGVKPCGLGARDTLRVEAGLPLYGHELSDEMSPLTAGLGWVISKTRDFCGSDAIRAARAAGLPFKLQGVRLEAKRLVPVGAQLFVEGRQVGSVSSGVVSPTLECGIAMAFLEPGVEPERPCEIELRGKLEPATIVSKRFYRRPSGP